MNSLTYLLTKTYVYKLNLFLYEYLNSNKVFNDIFCKFEVWLATMRVTLPVSSPPSFCLLVYPVVACWFVLVLVGVVVCFGFVVVFCFLIVLLLMCVS